LAAKNAPMAWKPTPRPRLGAITAWASYQWGGAQLCEAVTGRRSEALCFRGARTWHRTCNPRRVRFPFLLLTLTFTLYGQTDKSISLEPGFKIGSPVKSSGSEGLYGTKNDSHWTGGPTVELRLPYRFSIEADALFRTRRASSSYPLQLAADTAAYLSSNNSKSNIWDFPLLVKYRFDVLGLHPFVSAGYEWSRASSTYSSIIQCMGTTGSCLPTGYPGGELRGGFMKYSMVRGGGAGGAGLEFKTRYSTISPEVRVRRDGVTALVGFTFGGKQ
jgi:hypothetical protein